MKTDGMKLVTFRLGQDMFAADIFSVERVLRYVAPAAVPDAPAWVAGVIEHRGKVIPVVDLRRRIELDAASIAWPLASCSQRDRWLGWNDRRRGDRGRGVPATRLRRRRRCFAGLRRSSFGDRKIGEQLVVVLDVDRVLSSDDRIVLERAMGGAETLLRG
jgi:purine-binding chemotaxis protein CheW